MKIKLTDGTVETVTKIPRVPEDVCFGEQKIAYNFAFSYSEQIKKAYRNGTEEEKSDVLRLILRAVERCDFGRKKFNKRVIARCIDNGIEKYAQGYSILSSYAEIGGIFTV